jgi:hypothetical protein
METERPAIASGRRASQRAEAGQVQSGCVGKVSTALPIIRLNYYGRVVLSADDKVDTIIHFSLNFA